MKKHLPLVWKQTQMLQRNARVPPMSCISHVGYLGQHRSLLKIDNMTLREVLKHKKLIKCIIDVMIQLPIATNALWCLYKNSYMNMIIACGKICYRWRHMIHSLKTPKMRLNEWSGGWMKWWKDEVVDGWIGRMSFMSLSHKQSDYSH